MKTAFCAGMLGAVALGLSSTGTHADSLPPLYKSLDPASMDTSVDPCSDFYQYACGNWVKTTVPPGNYPMFDRSWSAIDLRVRATVRQILERYANGRFEPAIPEAQVLGDFYSTCMNTEQAEHSLPSLADEFRDIDRIKDARELAAKTADLRSKGATLFFGFYSSQDYKDASRTIAEMDSSGLSLPDPVYYAPTDPRGKKILKDFPLHIETMFKLAGLSESEAQRGAKAVVRIERDLARITLSSEKKRDTTLTYHPVTHAQFLKAAHSWGFDWAEFFSALLGSDTAPLAKINLADVAFFARLDSTIFARYPLESLKAYLKWHLLTAHASELTQAIVTESFNFFGKEVWGTKQISPRWQKCVRATSSYFGDAIGTAFTAEIGFSDARKKETERMISTIKTALDRDLDEIKWMDESTRTGAHAKLALVVPKIGYPEHPKSYDKLVVDSSSYFKSALNGELFASKFDLAKMGRPTDRNEWFATAHEANAFYHPAFNSVTFTAAGLQAPFYEAGAPAAANYGAVGSVMGHETTHGFDDAGARFDGFGNQVDWWSAESRKNFEARQVCIQDQFSAYTVGVNNDVHLNGKLETGENFADLGGVKLAYRAFEEAKRQDPSISRNVLGLSDEQQFFLAYGQVWCAIDTPESQETLAKSDPHPPSRFRVNGVLRNLPEFAQAFGCQKGSSMAPISHCSLW